MLQEVSGWYNASKSRTDRDYAMKPKIYVETTIVSYLTAWRSPQLVMAAHQETTRTWWDEERHRFELFVSEAVVQEASVGDRMAVQRRLEAITDLPELQITEAAGLW